MTQPGLLQQLPEPDKADLVPRRENDILEALNVRNKDLALL
jgi:hypothetical protein